MGLDYDKIRKESEEANWWASYSDLWSMLSVVFLLLYVVTSLRSGTANIQQNMEHQELQKRLDELEEQNRVYSILKDKSLQESSQQEQETYQKLMKQLTLLENEAKDEKEALNKQARENEEKQFALNQYQQIIRNIIDSNVLAKSQIHSRDNVIVEKKQTIQAQVQTIQNLNQDIEKKESLISENVEKIDAINNELNKQIEKLKSEQARSKLSKKAMEQTVERLKKESNTRVEALKKENEATQNELSKKIEDTKAAYLTQLNQLQEQHQQQLLSEKEAFEKSLKKQKLSAQKRAEKLAAFKEKAEEKARQLAGELGDLESKIQNAEGQLKQVKAEKLRTLASLDASEEEKARVQAEAENLKLQNKRLDSDLKQAKATLDAKRTLIKQIQKNFENAGIKAQVDGKTGDVIIDFGEEYFDSGKAQLKPGMIKKLEQMIPAYSKSLFENKKTASKLSNIEIVGFASSTYKGRYVNPSSLKPENQEAINYNLRLSFNRANAIFKHIFDPSKMTYENQKTLLPLVKVVGRGFLPEGKAPKDIGDSMPEKEFCKKYNCKSAQRVVIRFNLGE